MKESKVPNYLNLKLCNEIFNSNTTGMEECIKLGADVNNTEGGKTPLEIAYLRNNLAAFKLMLANGAKPNQSLIASMLDKLGTSIGSTSTRFVNLIEYFKLLIQNEYEFDDVNDTLLELLLAGAIRTHDNSFVEALIKQGANVKYINSIFENQPNMLELAFEFNNITAFNILLSHGACYSPQLLSSMYDKLRNSEKSRPKVNECFKLLIKSGYIFDVAKHYQYVKDAELLDLINQQNPTYWQKIKNFSSTIKSSLFGLSAQNLPEVSNKQDNIQIKALKRKRAESISSSSDNRSSTGPKVADVQPNMADNSDEKIHPKPTKRAKMQRIYSREEAEAAVKIQRTWRKYRINKMINTATINDPLHIKQVQARFAELNIDPPLPKQESQIDQAKVKSYLKDIADPINRKIAKKVIENHITYLSTSDLIKRAIQSSQNLNNYLCNNSLNTDINILIEKKHSSEWIAGIAARYLNIRPKDILSYSRWQLDRIKISYSKQNTASVLLMDDVTYSGIQLKSNLFFIANKHLENCKPNGNFSHFRTFIESNSTLLSPKQLDIYVMILFMNEYAFKSINSLTDDFKKIGINLVMIKPKVLRNIRNCGLSEEELKRFSLISGGSYFSENRCDFDYKMLLFSSWKKPDHVSMPGNFSDGCVPDNLKKPGKANVAHMFLPDVKPPYHRK